METMEVNLLNKKRIKSELFVGNCLYELVSLKGLCSEKALCVLTASNASLVLLCFFFVAFSKLSLQTLSTLCVLCVHSSSLLPSSL